MNKVCSRCKKDLSKEEFHYAAPQEGSILRKDLKLCKECHAEFYEIINKSNDQKNNHPSRRSHLFLPWSGLWVKYTMMKKIIVKIEDFKTTVEKLRATLKDSDSGLHFFSSDGYIIEYHLSRCNEVKNPKYVKPFHATHEPVNYSPRDEN